MYEGEKTRPREEMLEHHPTEKNRLKEIELEYDVTIASKRKRYIGITASIIAASSLAVGTMTYIISRNQALEQNSDNSQEETYSYERPKNTLDSIIIPGGMGFVLGGLTFSAEVLFFYVLVLGNIDEENAKKRRKDYKKFRERVRRMKN